MGTFNSTGTGGSWTDDSTWAETGQPAADGTDYVVITAGDVVTLPGNTGTGAISIQGEITGNGHTLTLNGSGDSPLVNFDGTITATSNLNLTIEADENNTIDCLGTGTFNNVIIDNVGYTTTLTHTLECATLTITAGTLDTGSNKTLTVTGATDVAGTLTLNGSTCSFGDGGYTGHYGLRATGASGVITADADSTVAMSSLYAADAAGINIALSGTNTINKYRASNDMMIRLTNNTVDSDMTLTVTTTEADKLMQVADANVTLILNASSGTPARKIADSAMSLKGLTITNGTLDTDSSNNYALTVTGNTKVTGTLTGNNSTLIFGTDGVYSTVEAGGLWVEAAGSLTFGSGDLTAFSGFTAKGSEASPNVTSTGGGDIIINGRTNNGFMNSHGHQGVNITGDYIIDYDNNSIFDNRGGTTIACGTFIIKHDGRTYEPWSNSGADLFKIIGNMEIQDGTFDTEYSGQSSQPLTVTGNTTGAGTLTLNNSTYTGGGHLSMTGTVTIGTSGVITGVDQLGESGGTITCTGSPTLGFERWRQPTANWTPATSTIKLEGHTRAFQTNGYGVPYNLEIDNSGNTNELSSFVVVSNNLTITAGTLDTSSSNHALTVTGTITVNSTSNTANLNINDSVVSCAKIAVESADTITASHSSNAMTVTGAGISTGRSIDFTGVISGTLDIICTHPNTTEADLSASSGAVNHLTLNHASLIMKMNSSATIGNLTITLGEFHANDAGGAGKNLTVSSNVIVTSGTLDLDAASSDGNASIGGTLLITAGEVITAGAGSLTVTGATTIGDAGHSSEDQATLTCNAGGVSLGSGKTDGYAIIMLQGGTFAGGAANHTTGPIKQTAANTKFTFTSATTTINSEYTSEDRMFELTAGKAYNADGRITLTGNFTSCIQWTGPTGDTGPHNLRINDASLTVKPRNTLYVEGYLQIDAGTFNTQYDGVDKNLTVTGQLDMNGGTLTLNGSTFELGNLAQSGGTINGNTSTINLNAGTVGGWVWYRTGGTWNYNTSTVVYKDNGKHMEGEFYNLIIECASSTHTGVWRADGLASVIMKCANDLTVKEGIWKRDADAETMTIVGDVSIESGGTLGQTSETGANSFESLTIASGGTYVATSGTTTLNGNFTNNGTFTHNDGKIDSAAYCEVTGSGTTTFYDFESTSGQTRFQINITIENNLTTSGSASTTYIWLGTTLTMGTATSAATLVHNKSTLWFYAYSGGNLATLQGASAVYPVQVQGSVGTFNFGGGGGIAQLSNVDFQRDITTDGATDHIKLTGDCEFDAVTVSSGDTLDLNGKRAEFSGLLSSTGTIACGTNALVVADSVNTSSTTSGNMNLIETGDGHTHTLTSSTITNWMLNGGTISNSAHGHAADNIIIGTGKLDQGNNLASGTPIVNVTTATGADLDSNTHTLTLSGDLTMSGGLIGKSAVLFDGTNDVGSAPSATASTTNPTDNLFVEAWWKSTNTTPETTSVIGKEDSYLLYINSSGYFQGYVYGSSSDISVSGGWMGSIFDQKWHHIAMGYSQAGGLKIWLDGRLVGYNATNAGTLNQNANGLRIMRYGSNYGQGTVAMGRIWTGAVPTDAQLRSNMFKGEADSPAYTSGVIQTAWYFDEGTGTTVEDVGVGTDADLLLEGSPAWAAGGTYDKTNGPAIVMAGTTQDITCKNGLDIYDLTINDGSTTSIHTIDNSAGRLDVYGNLTVNEKLTSSASSNTSGITMKTAAKTLTVASDVKTTALATLYQVVLDHGGTTDIGEMNLKLVELQSGATLRATGDFTVTTELEVGNTCTLNANGKTLTCKLLDMNGASTLDLASSTLILSSTDGLTSHPNVTLNGGPAATVSGSSAATTFESQNNFVIVGNIENLNVTNEELSILGNVTNCTGDIHRWNPTIDTGQMLDADTADDRDVRLGSDLDRNTELVT